MMKSHYFEVYTKEISVSLNKLMARYMNWTSGYAMFLIHINLEL